MKPINILSLFDGISSGRVALERLGIPIKNYYASEIKKSAIICSQANYPDIIQIGDITKIDYCGGYLIWNDGQNSQFVGEIDLLMGGSCCQDFSPVKWINWESKGLKGDKSNIFYEYLRLLQEIKPKYYLLENVKMTKKNEKLLTDFLLKEYPDTKVYHINSKLVSFQNRPRIYWTNISNIKLPKDKNIDFQDYINKDYNYCKEFKVNKTPSREKMWNNGKGRNQNGACANITHAKKVYCITRKQDRFPNSGLIEFDGFCRYLTRKEIEQGQTLPIGYTDCLSYGQMQDVCGDGWTVDVIKHILSFIKWE